MKKEVQEKSIKKDWNLVESANLSIDNFSIF